MPRKKTQSQNHIHRYEKVYLGKKRDYEVFRCNLPNCTHYLRKELVKDKISLCNRCGEPMVMDTRAMQLMKPHCVPCIERRQDSGLDNLADALR